MRKVSNSSECECFEGESEWECWWQGKVLGMVSAYTKSVKVNKSADNKGMVSAYTKKVNTRADERSEFEYSANTCL